jgi:hypothetical protein
MRGSRARILPPQLSSESRVICKRLVALNHQFGGAKGGVDEDTSNRADELDAVTEVIREVCFTHREYFDDFARYAVEGVVRIQVYAGSNWKRHHFVVAVQVNGF